MLISNQRVSHPVPSWESPEFSLPSQITHNSINPTWKCLLLPDRSPLTYCGFSPSSTSQVGPDFQKDWENILSRSAKLLDLQSELSSLPHCWRAWAEKRPAAPHLEEGKGIPPFPGAGAGTNAIASAPSWCPSSWHTASLQGLGGAKRMNHIWHNSAAPQGNVRRVLK